MVPIDRHLGHKRTLKGHCFKIGSTVQIYSLKSFKKWGPRDHPFLFGEKSDCTQKQTLLLSGSTARHFHLQNTAASGKTDLHARRCTFNSCRNLQPFDIEQAPTTRVRSGSNCNRRHNLERITPNKMLKGHSSGF